MALTRFIGDIHGLQTPYKELLKGVDRSIQIGDFGVGFGDRKGQAKSIDEMLDAIPGDHRFIRGNHDNPTECKFSKHWIPDGTSDGDVMYVGGALSIDKDFRTPGVSWWEDEELSISDLRKVIGFYKERKPRVLVTHETTESFARDVMIPLVRGLTNFPSRTRDALEEMYSFHRPEIHIFGHWHHDVDFNWNGTRMICLNELKYIDLEV